MYRSFLAGALAAALLGPSGTAAQQNTACPPVAGGIARGESDRRGATLAVGRPSSRPRPAAPSAATASRPPRPGAGAARDTRGACRRCRLRVATWPRRSRSTPWRAASSASATRCGRVMRWRAPSHRARRRSADPGGPIPAARTALRNGISSSARRFGCPASAAPWPARSRPASPSRNGASRCAGWRSRRCYATPIGRSLRRKSELRVARDRLTTARGVGRDFDRRVAFGDIAATEALLGRNEELSALLELGRAEAAVAQTREHATAP